MSNTNLLVLNILAQGRISADEAERLLLGLSERRARVATVIGETKPLANTDRITVPGVLPTYFGELQPAWM